MEPSENALRRSNIFASNMLFAHIVGFDILRAHNSYPQKSCNNCKLHVNGSWLKMFSISKLKLTISSLPYGPQKKKKIAEHFQT